MISATSSSAARTAIKTIQSSTCVIDTNQTKPLQACHPVRIVILPEVSSCQKCHPERLAVILSAAKDLAPRTSRPTESIGERPLFFYLLQPFKLTPEC